MFGKLDFDRINKFEDFKYWFIRKYANMWKVVPKDNSDFPYNIYYNEIYDSIICDPASDIPEHFDAMEVDIKLDFDKFRNNRPEYYVGKSVSPEVIANAESANTIYETLIVGVAFMRAMSNGCQNPDKVFSKIEPCLNWLRNTDFYIAPASSIYHESEPSGLLRHSLRVVNKIVDLLSTETFQNINYEDAVLCALVHDWCKIDQYESYLKNVKNDETGVWEKVTAYRRKGALVPLGHGVSSMFLANKFFKLSTAEALAIRWHMGAWRVVPSEYDELQHANETTPLVHLLQFADQLAITHY